MRIRIKRYLICAVVIVLCVTLLTGGTLSQSVRAEKQSDNTPFNEDIVGLYQELIKVRQQVLDETERLIEHGRGTIQELADAKAKVAEARIQLAQYQGNQDTVIEELQKLTQFLIETRKSMIGQVDAGQLSPMIIYEYDIMLLETKIRLAKARQGTQ